MCASSPRPWLTGSVPMGTRTGTNRWSLSPTRKPRCPGPPIGCRPRRAVAPVQSVVARIQHKSANHGLHSHQPVSTGGPARENPCDRASPVEPTDKPRCRAGFPGRSVGRTPWPDTVRHMEMFARRDRHNSARRAAKMCSKAANPSVARILSFRSTSAAPPRKGSRKPPPTSSRHHPKSPKNHSISNASGQFVRGQPDSSVIVYLVP
jgi:hypothetical protein